MKVLFGFLFSDNKVHQEIGCWFFFQVLFVGGSGGLLVQGTLKGLGYEVELIDLAKVEIPVALTALVVACIYFTLKDKRLRQKYLKSGRSEKGKS